MNRRHALKLLGISSVLPSCRREPALLTYTSFAFGTEIHFQTYGIPESLFKTVSEATTVRLAEIDALFSLYNPESSICRLNRNGFLDEPPGEFLHLIRTAFSYGEKTAGLFDITVQPLWNFREKWKQASLPERAALEKQSWEQALSMVDFRKITATENRISFGKPGMAVTMNAIAQGHATDAIHTLLKQADVKNALVNIGEYAALGSAPDGKPWPIRILTKTKAEIPRTLPPESALAVSAGYGHTFDPEGLFHHIFHPATGENTKSGSTLIVNAPTATEADALATSLSVANAAERNTILLAFPNTRFEEIS